MLSKLLIFNIYNINFTYLEDESELTETSSNKYLHFMIQSLYDNLFLYKFYLSLVRYM